MMQRRWAMEELDRLFVEKGGLVDCHRHLGVQDLNKINMPLASGAIREEVRELGFTRRRQFDLELLAEIATVNGRKILGLPIRKEK